MAAGCVIGVDLGGTKLLAGTVDSRLQVHHRARRLVASQEPSAVVELIVGAVEEAIEAAADEVIGVGLGVPALVDPRTGVVRDSNHLLLHDVPLRDLISERLGLPVVVDNDANAAIVVEWRCGAARGATDAIMLTLGTGIGGGLIVGERLVHGSGGAAAELGHIIVEADGPPCPGRCPNHGCLEALVSGHAIGREGLRLAYEEPSSALGRALAEGREISGALVTEFAHDGDPAALEIMSEMGRRLGLGIVSLVNIFNPDVVVVGGGAIAAGELLLAPARAVVATRALEVNREAVRIVSAHFGAEAGMLGAACMAWDAAGIVVG
jgi:glucokinase